ncbi:MAG: hypothetical protein ACWA5A_09365 [Marinibacterium sp.]
MINETLLRDVQKYCADLGISEATLAVRALNNSRFFDRLRKSRERERRAVTKLRHYMAANPPREDAA